jgi:FtsZ-interacting cell division protein ZipA
MDASTFRWVLIIIAVVLALAIYLFGQHQARLRKRNAIGSFTREEIDSTIVEDEQLLDQMNNLSTLLEENEIEESLDEILLNSPMEAQKTPLAMSDPEIYAPQWEPADNEVEESLNETQNTAAMEAQETPSVVPDAEILETQELADNEVEESLDETRKIPAMEAQQTPLAMPDAEIFVPTLLTDKDEDLLISHHLRHSDFRLIVGEEAESAAHHAGLELDAEGLLEYREEGELVFHIASLSEPGNFFEIDDLNFVTLGFNCFIDLDSCANPRLAYESMLKKIDELVRILNVKVYKPDHELLTINDVTEIREKLA